MCHTWYKSDLPGAVVPDVELWSMHVMATHGTEVGHFQNDPMLSEVAESTIFDNDIILDLFWFSNSRMI